MTTNNAINQGVFVSGTATTGFVPVATSANTATWQNVLSGILPTSSEVMHVSGGGNDSTGTGTFNNPYLTITAAQTAITDNTPTKRYVIQCSAGSFALPSSVNPDIMFKGQGPQLTTFTGATNINNAGWNSALNADHRLFFMDCYTTGILTFDCSTQTNNTAGKLYLYNVRTGTTNTFTAQNSVNQMVAQNCEFFGGFTVSGGTANFNCCTNESGTYTINSSATLSTTAMINSGKNAGNYSVNYTATHGVITFTLAGVGNNLSSTLALSGASANVIASADSIPTYSNITYANGASITNITALNGALNPLVGQATLTAGTVTVSNANIKSTSNFQLTALSSSAMGSLRVTTITAGTSFVITSSLNTDTGLVSYVVYP